MRSPIWSSQVTGVCDNMRITTIPRVCMHLTGQPDILCQG